LEPEAAYQQLYRVLDSANRLISTYHDPSSTLSDWTVTPTNGTVCFAAAKQNWSFRLIDFARMYADRFSMKPDELAEKFWGDWYWDASVKKWIESPISSKGEKLERGFVQFVMVPIMKVFSSCGSGNQSQVNEIVERLSKIKPSLQFTEKEKQIEPKELVKLIMSRWLPFTQSCTEMIALHLPSPSVASKYRTEVLYTGPLDDDTAKSMRACDPNGPVVVYISKMFPMPGSTKFFAFGRVFSGTVRTGQKVRVMGAGYSPKNPQENKDELFDDVSIQRVLTVMTTHPEPSMDDAMPAGNTVALAGIDKYLSKSGTVTDNKQSWPLQNLKHANSPVMRVSVSPKRQSDLTKLIEAMKRLSKADPLVLCTTNPDTKEHIIAGSGDLHLQTCLSILRSYMGDSEIVVGEPVVPCKETMIAKSSVICLGKSPNGHNRLYMTAQPLEDELLNELSPTNNNNNNSNNNNNNNNNNTQHLATMDPKSRARILIDKFGWEEGAARKIWAFSPIEQEYANVLCETTKGVQYLQEIKDSIVSTFVWGTTDGVLCGEPLRGVRFDLVDVHVHADNAHRGPSQIVPTTKRLLQAAQLSGQPRLMEPIFLCEIATSQKGLSGIYQVLNARRAKIIETIDKGVAGAFLVKAHLPVLESFALTDDLREATSGNAFPQCTFSHYEIVAGDPLDQTKPSLALTLVKNIRKRKGMPDQIPSLANLNDKL